MGHQSHTVVEDQKPALVLDVSCNLHMDLSLSVVGKIKEFASLPNIKNILAAEGFDDIDIRYMGGFWVLFQFVSNIQKDKFLAHVGVGSWFTKLQHASSNFKLDERVTWIDIEGKIFWIRAKEVTGWTPDFNECEDDFTNSDNESSGVNNEEPKNKAISDVDSEVEEIPETIFDADIPKSGGSTLQLMKDLINVGQTMGYKMDGCINNFKEIVKNQGA
ncbi:hypothetical protein Tco_1381268 [Tanacetum coccineum]